MQIPASGGGRRGRFAAMTLRTGGDQLTYIIPRISIITAVIAKPQIRHGSILRHVNDERA